MKIKKITKNTEKTTTYDFEVKNQHHYFMENGITSHNTSSSLVQGCTASVLPIFSKFYVDKNSKGAVPIMPPFVGSKFWFYKEMKNISQKDLITVVSRVQKWTDTGISMELLFNLNAPGINAKFIYDTVKLAWEKKLKTIYYVRWVQKNSSDVSDKAECLSCAN